MDDIFKTDPSLISFLRARKDYLGEFLGAMRDAYELTQQDVSEATDYSIQTISKLENGRGNPMGIAGKDIFAYLCEQSGLTLDEILKELSHFCRKMKAAEEHDEKLMQ